MQKTRLVVAQALVNIALPVFAAVYFGVAAPEHRLESLRGAVAAAILPLLFIALMQVVCLAERGQALPTGALASGLGLPFLLVGLVALIEGVTLGWYLFEMGALYTMAILLAFLGLVFLRPFLIGVVRTFTIREAMGYLGIAALQLVFIGPGLFVCWLYLRMLGAQAWPIDGGGLSAWLRLGVLAVVLVPLVVHEYRWMEKASPILAGSRTRQPG